ncbi:hypothetical protein GPNCGGLF_LOCUS4043 [Methylorubrum aminovorans]
MPDNGQVERMNRTIKDATVRHFLYDSHEQLRQHPADFVAAHTRALPQDSAPPHTPRAICTA